MLVFNHEIKISFYIVWVFFFIHLSISSKYFLVVINNTVLIEGSKHDV